MVIQETYSPQPMAVNSTYFTSSPSIGGFIAVTAGTITITDGLGSVELANFPVAAGSYNPLPMFLGNRGATITLAGGASGTLLV